MSSQFSTPQPSALLVFEMRRLAYFLVRDAHSAYEMPTVETPPSLGARTHEFLERRFLRWRTKSSALRIRSPRGRILAIVLHVYDGMSVGNLSVKRGVRGSGLAAAP